MKKKVFVVAFLSFILILAVSVSSVFAVSKLRGTYHEHDVCIRELLRLVDSDTQIVHIYHYIELNWTEDELNEYINSFLCEETLLPLCTNPYCTAPDDGIFIIGGHRFRLLCCE